MAGSKLLVRAALATAVTVVVVAAVTLVSCTAARKPATPRVKPVPEAALTLAVTPAKGATNLPVSTEIGTAVSGGTVRSVVLTDPAGRTLAGTMRQDGTSWIPDEPLDYGSKYTATVTASGGGGNRTESVTFSTMPRPDNRIETGLYVSSGEVYGVALPLAIEFDEEIPESARAAVQRRLFVSSDPPQPGIWHWYGGRQVLYRPQQYWQPGTRIAVRAALGGLPVGRKFLDSDRSAQVTIGNRVEIAISNSPKQMTVFVDGRPVRTMPVSLGKPSTPSSSGKMVIMTKAYSTIFDTTNEGPGGYRVSVNYAMRLTWGGEFIHAAPWSVGDQGVRNVSHGCVNMSTPDAAWLFGVAHVGDPVTVTGTGVPLQPGNGWTAWDMDWQKYLAGSALPYSGPTGGTAGRLAARASA